MTDTEVFVVNKPESILDIKKATIKDHETVVKVLCTAFKQDPHMTWLLEKSNHPKKLEIMMSYLFHKTLSIGTIYLTSDNQAVALWKSENQEQLSWEYIKRNFMFLLKIGLPSVLRILENEKFTYRQYPKKCHYFHLYLIGVLPENQGKGYASKLINPIVEEMSLKSIPVYLETANAVNIRIYEKKGFKVYNTWTNHGLHLYYMKKNT